MLKKTIKYVDFNDVEVEEDFFFHLSQAELVELEMGHEGGLSESLQRIVAAQDSKSIIAEFKNIILTAYGQKSLDGRRFIKNQQLREEFESSEAYSTLFMELVTNTDSAIEFINGIIPKGLAEEAAKVVNKEVAPLAVASQVEPPNIEVVVMTKSEVAAMPADEWPQLSARIAAGEVKIAE